LKENQKEKERKKHNNDIWNVEKVMIVWIVYQGLPIAFCQLPAVYNGLDGPENNDEQNGELHDRKSPELHRAKSNGSEEDQKEKEECNGSIEHSSKFKAQSKIQNS